jgi:ribonuclease Z
MAQRELIILGSSAMTPTRERNHNGYLLRWDNEQILFDPGEGTQRQLLLAHRSANKITRICITHFHGDHCLGLPGIFQRLSLDQARGPVSVYYPAEGQQYFENLRNAAAFHETTPVQAVPCSAGVVATSDHFVLSAAALDHRIPTLGWRLEEPRRRHLVGERLAALGLSGPAIGALQREGSVQVDGRRIGIEEVSEDRDGQRFAFIMDTALCDAAFELAADTDLLVCEATYLDADEELARRYKHLTAAQAGRIAAEAGARRLVLTHFSQRYGDPAVFAEQAGRYFDDVVVAQDLATVAVPDRRAAEATT